MQSGQFTVTRLKSLAIALREVERFVRDPDKLRSGRKMKNFGWMLPRELLGNVLLCLVANPDNTADHMAIMTDPFNSDGLIVDEGTGDAWLMEHIYEPGITPKTPNGPRPSWCTPMQRELCWAHVCPSS